MRVYLKDFECLRVYKWDFNLNTFLSLHLSKNILHKKKLKTNQPRKNKLFLLQSHKLLLADRQSGNLFKTKKNNKKLNFCFCTSNVTFDNFRLYEIYFILVLQFIYLIYFLRFYFAINHLYIFRP